MKTVSLFKYVFTITGALMITGAFLFYLNTRDFVNSATLANGTVVENIRSRSSDSITYKPVLRFRTHTGRTIEFTSSVGSNPATYSRGDVVEVLYQSSSPDQARINGFFSLWGFSLILALLGFGFSVAGLSIVLFGILKVKKVKYLKRHGVPVLAKFQGVNVNDSIRVNGRSPYQISAQWQNPYTSEIHTFNSDNIWFDPTDYINRNDITVLIDKKNPDRHYIDISFLPKIAS